jgi:hypothetical protein
VQGYVDHVEYHMSQIEGITAESAAGTA